MSITQPADEGAKIRDDSAPKNLQWPGVYAPDFRTTDPDAYSGTPTGDGNPGANSLEQLAREPRGIPPKGERRRG